MLFQKMEEDVSNNRSCQVDSDSDDDEYVLDDNDYIQYYREQDEDENQLLLHWIKLCEDNYRDIRTEEEVTRKIEIRVNKLQKVHNNIYPDFKSAMRHIRDHNSIISELSQQYPNCFIREGNYIIPLSKQVCRKKLYNYLNQCFSVTHDNSLQYQNSPDRGCFANEDDELFFIGNGKHILDMFFRKLGKEYNHLMPDLVVSTRKFPVKHRVLIQGRNLFLKGRAAFEILSRLNEEAQPKLVEKFLKEESLFSEMSENGDHLDTRNNKLRCTYVISESDSSEDFGDMASVITEEEAQSAVTKCTPRSFNSLSSQPRTFSRGTPLPRISSIHTSKPLNENQCMVEGNAIKRRPLSGPEIIPSRFAHNPDKIYRELPPLLSKRGQRHRGIDLETKHIDKTLNKIQVCHKKTRPNSPIKRPVKTYRTPHHVDISFSGPDEDHESKLDRSLPLPPINDQNRHRKCH